MLFVTERTSLRLSLWFPWKYSSKTNFSSLTTSKLENRTVDSALFIALSKVNKVNSHAFGNSGRVDLSHIDKDLYSITKFYDKSPGSFVPRWDNELRTCGISISGPHLFDYIKRARPKDLQNEFTDGPVRSLILQERTILGLKLSGNIYDIGFPLGYEFCCNQIRTFKPSPL